MAYVIGRAEPWYCAHLGGLYRRWSTWNDEYFGGRLVAPYFLFSEPSCPRSYGDCSRVSCFGGYGQIRIRPSLVTGRHKHLRPGPEYAEGRRRFVEDVALHECIHAYTLEVLDDAEPSYKGHGPTFARECNRIGAALGLPPVRPAKARGKDKDLPTCAEWPHCVRPPDYYLGAYVPPGGGKAGAKAKVIGEDDPFVQHLQGAASALLKLYERASCHDTD
jgi:hypothetical protein